MPRRLVYIGHSPTINTGQGAVSRRLCGALHRAGFHVAALGMGEERRHPPTLPYRLWVPCKHDTMGRSLLPQLMATEAPDLVFVHGDLEMASESIAALRRIAPHIPVALYYSVEGEPIHAGWAAMIRSVDLAMVYTKHGREVTQRSTRRDVPAIPLGIDASEFGPLPPDERSRWRTALGWNDKFAVCYVARNMWTKQQPVLLNACRSLVDGGLNELLLYLHCRPFDRHRHGGWDLTTMTRGLGLEGVVRFPSGELAASASAGDADAPGMREIYACCDLYAHPSAVEGFGFPLLEAMACGRAVVHTADGGVMDEVCGPAGEGVAPAAWTVSAFGGKLHILDPQRLADAIRRLHREWRDDPEQWRLREQEALRRAALFPWERTESEVVARLTQFLGA